MLTLILQTIFLLILFSYRAGVDESILWFFLVLLFPFKSQAINPLYEISFYSLFWWYCHFIWSSVSLNLFFHSSSNVRWYSFFKNTTLPAARKEQFPSILLYFRGCLVDAWWLFSGHEYLSKLTFLRFLHTFSFSEWEGAIDVEENQENLPPLFIKWKLSILIF